ncbi:g4510 [Coccomyxa elongata]
MRGPGYFAPLNGKTRAGSIEDLDTQRKCKQDDARSRSHLLFLIFFTTAAVGFITAQYLYIWTLKLDGGANMGKEHGGAAALDTDLHSILMRVAPPVKGRPKEVLIAISNFNLVPGGQLPLWLQTVKEAGVKNYLVVAIDTQLRDHLVKQGFNVYFKDLKVDKAQEGTGDNHAISALKFKIIQEFLELGWNVLLSDVDVIVVQDPFQHLYRDHDIEGMSDGFDDATAYGNINGLDDPSMGWSRYAQGTTHLNLNSGLFYIQANARTIDLMKRIAARLAKEKAWDQSVYNEEIFFLSHGKYKSPGVTVRVMDIYTFMNSKVLFRTVRYRQPSQQVKPVMVHINYHPDKVDRARAAYKYFVKGDVTALRAFPGGG